MDCPLPKEGNKKEELFCANCGQPGHPSSYKGCNVRLNLVKKIKLNQKQKELEARERLQMQAFAIESAKRGLDPNLSWANVATGKTAMNGGAARPSPPGVNGRQHGNGMAARPSPPGVNGRHHGNGSAAQPAPSGASESNTLTEQPTPQAEFFTSECSRLFTCNMGGLMTKLNDFLPKYRSASLQDQQVMYLNLLMSICQTN